MRGKFEPFSGAGETFSSGRRRRVGAGVMEGTMMTAMIAALRPKDRVRQDSEPIAMMYRTMGTQAAEEVVNRAISELTLTVSGLGVALRENGGVDLPRQLRRMQRMAEQLGLVSLGQVATDLRACMDGQDEVAFAAVWARMIRVAGVSLAAEEGALDQSV